MDPNVVFHLLFWPLFVYSIVAHEVAHAWVAKLMGDDTAERMGRITANPIPHIDPVWSILVPAVAYIASGGRVIFGGARPVPVNPLKFRRLVLGDILVSISGVAANFIIAFLASVVLRFFYPGTVNFEVFLLLMSANVFLMIFNLIPIPPLDGSHVFEWILPKESRDAYRRIGYFGFILVLFIIRIPVVSEFL